MTRISPRLVVQWLDVDQVAVIHDESPCAVVVEVAEIPALVATLEHFASLAGSAPAVPTQRAEGDRP